MRNILIPFDFSKYAQSAAKTGAALARKTGAQLNLLHVVYAPPEWDRMTVSMQQNYPEVEARMVDAEIKLDKYAEDDTFKGVNVQTFVYSGVAHEQIIQFAKAYKMDLIIMGAHGAGESDKLFVGSTAQRIMRKATVPVLSVKKEYTPKAIKKILFPSDFEEGSMNSLNTVKNLAADLHASITLLFVNTPFNFYDTPSAEARMADFIPVQRAVKFHSFIYNDFDKEKGILNFARQKKMDLIAMVTHNRKGRPNYQLGVTETLLYHTDIPVLSMVMK
ncbi:MAG: universal stress protein [Flammeovirgaceae bacterium]|nr:MAG: universal stress protein [Flammeovirgaceae bacterium]